MFKHIPLPIDGSELSLRAVDTGIALASQLGARVYALHVMEPFPAATYFAVIVQANEAMHIEQSVANAERYPAQVRPRADATGMPFDGGYEIDNRPYNAIIGAAEKHQCDLIVMAPHGWHGFDRLLLGSETQKVLLHGDLPVLVCP